MLITDLLPSLAKLFMTKQLGDIHLSAVQMAVLVGLGLQHKTVDDLSGEEVLVNFMNHPCEQATSINKEVKVSMKA